MTDHRNTPDPMVGPPYLELCEECWGESDPIDDLFQCSACRGRHWVCIDCGHIEGECTCDPNDDSGGPDGF